MILRAKQGLHILQLREFGGKSYNLLTFFQTFYDTILKHFIFCKQVVIQIGPAHLQYYLVL